MPFVQAKCPECGGMLAVDDSKKAAVCLFCGEAFIVQEAIINYNTYNTTNNTYDNRTTHNYGEGSVVNIIETSNKDFVIEARVLKEYHGEAVDVVIPDSVIKINEKCFSGLCIKSVVIPDSVTEIQSGAFARCTSLTSINIPDGVTSIGFGAFAGCTSLTSIKIPDSVTEIQSYAFRGCTSLTSVEIPDSVTEIEGMAFAECTSLTSVRIPKSVKKMGPGSFMGCIGLKTVELDGSYTFTKYGGVECSSGTANFWDCKNISCVIVRGDYMRGKDFSNCSKLTTIIVPENFNRFNCFDIFYSIAYTFPKTLLVKNENGTVPSGFWRHWNRCQYCGGVFNQGWFTIKCSHCGKTKEY